jgi:hypothetical protein
MTIIYQYSIMSESMGPAFGIFRQLLSKCCEQGGLPRRHSTESLYFHSVSLSPAPPIGADTVMHVFGSPSKKHETPLAHDLQL